jgi:hypothetical protein
VSARKRSRIATIDEVGEASTAGAAPGAEVALVGAGNDPRASCATVPTIAPGARDSEGARAPSAEAAAEVVIADAQPEATAAPDTKASPDETEELLDADNADAIDVAPNDEPVANALPAAQSPRARFEPGARVRLANKCVGVFQETRLAALVSVQGSIALAAVVRP